MNPYLSVAIHQPNFLPWTGYFLKMALCDIFVFLDDVQFSRKRASRTELISRGGKALTISMPVHLPHGFQTTYAQAIPAMSSMTKNKLLNKIKENYLHAPYFDRIFPIIEMRIRADNKSLSDFNIGLIKDFCVLLKIASECVTSSELNVLSHDKNNRNLEIVKKLHGKVYWSGTGALAYNNPAVFEENQIQLRYAETIREKLAYIEADEIHLSIVHQLFNYGPEAVQKEISNLRDALR